MSLILEALKKLEREKGTPDRGFLVVAHVPWPASVAGRSLWLGATAALGVIGLLGFVLLRGRGGPGALPTPPPVTVAPAAASAPAVSAPTASAPSEIPPSASAPTASSAPSAPATSVPTRPTATPILVSPPPVVPAPRPPATLAATGRFPTPAPSAAGEIDLRLNAITSQDGRPVAVLNDRVVREGDVFDAIRVIRIGEAEVEVEINGKRRVVRF